MTELKRLDYSIFSDGRISIAKKDFDEMIARMEKLDKEVTELRTENEQLKDKLETMTSYHKSMLIGFSEMINRRDKEVI